MAILVAAPLIWIFGEIYSPSEGRESFRFERVGGRRFRVSGAMPLDEFAAKAKLQLDEEAVETLAGLLLHEYGELPAEGAIMELRGLRFSIESVQDNRIHTVVVERIEDPGKSESNPTDGTGG